MHAPSMVKRNKHAAALFTSRSARYCLKLGLSSSESLTSVNICSSFWVHCTPISVCSAYVLRRGMIQNGERVSVCNSLASQERNQKNSRAKPQKEKQVLGRMLERSYGVKHEKIRTQRLNHSKTELPTTTVMWGDCRPLSPYLQLLDHGLLPVLIVRRALLQQPPHEVLAVVVLEHVPVLRYGERGQKKKQRESFSQNLRTAAMHPQRKMRQALFSQRGPHVLMQSWQRATRQAQH